MRATLAFSRLKSYDIKVENYFCVRRKNRRKHNEHFELLFFMKIYTLVHETNYLNIEKQLYFSWVVFIWSYILWRSKEDSHRLSTVYYKFCCSVWTETTQKTVEVTTAKNFFSSVYVTVTTCFDKCFWFHVITGRYCFLNKSLAITLNFFNRHVLAVLEMSDLKEVRILFLISTTKV